MFISSMNVCTSGLLLQRGQSVLVPSDKRVIKRRLAREEGSELSWQKERKRNIITRDRRQQCELKKARTLWSPSSVTREWERGSVSSVRSHSCDEPRFETAVEPASAEKQPIGDQYTILYLKSRKECLKPTSARATAD